MMALEDISGVRSLKTMGSVRLNTPISELESQVSEPMISDRAISRMRELNGGWKEEAGPSALGIWVMAQPSTCMICV
jgi:hypothetical protein